MKSVESKNDSLILKRLNQNGHQSKSKERGGGVQSSSSSWITPAFLNHSVIDIDRLLELRWILIVLLQEFLLSLL